MSRRRSALLADGGCLRSTLPRLTGGTPNAHLTRGRRTLSPELPFQQRLCIE